MAGPIATAFVDIVARLKFDSNNDLEKGILTQVKKAENAFDRLENVADKTAQEINQRFARLEININARNAIADIDRVAAATETATAQLRELSGKELGIGTGPFKEEIKRLEANLVQLKNTFTSFDGETLNLNFERVEQQVRTFSTQFQRLLRQVTELDSEELGIDTAPALAAMKTLGERVVATLADVKKFDEQSIRVNIDDTKIESLQTELASLLADIKKVSETSVDVKVDDSQLTKTAKIMADVRANQEALVTGEPVEIKVDTTAIDRAEKSLEKLKETQRETREAARAASAGSTGSVVSEEDIVKAVELEEKIDKATEKVKELKRTPVTLETSEAEHSLRDLLTSAERKFKALGAAAKSSLKDALAAVSVEINTREAIAGLQGVGRAAEVALDGVRKITTSPIDLNTDKLNSQLSLLNSSLAAVKRTIDSIGDEPISVNFEQLEAKTKVAKDQISRVIAELAKLSGKGVDVNISQALSDLRLLEERLKSAFADVQKIDGETITVNVNELDIDKLRQDLTSVNAEIAKVSGKSINVNTAPARREIDSLNKDAQQFGNTFERVALRLSATALIGGAVAGIQQLVSAGIQAAAQIETITISLDRLFKGFADLGQQLGGTSTQFLQNLKALAVTTPFQFSDLGDISTKLIQIDTNLTKLKGSVKDSLGEFPTRSEVAIDRLKALADAGAAVGATASDINGVVKAISQLSAKGKINLQDLNQIAERFPNFQRQLQIESIITQLNKVRPSLHATVADFNDLRAKGLIPVNVAVDGLFEGLKNIPGAAGAAAAQARTLTGALSNLKDFATIKFAESFSGVGEVIADQLNKAFSDPKTTTGLESAINNVIDSAGIATQDAFPAILKGVQDISDEVAGAITAVGHLISSLASGFGKDVFSGVLNGLTGIINLVTALSEALSALPAVVGETFGQLGANLLALNKISPGLTQALLAPFKNLATDVSQSLQGIFKGGVGISEAFAGIGSSLAGAGIAAAAVVGFTLLENSLATASKRAAEFKQSINDAAKSLKDFSDPVQAASDFLSKFTEAGKGINIGAFEGLFDGLTSTQLEANLGVTQDQLAGIIKKLTEAGITIKELGNQVQLKPGDFGFDPTKAPSEIQIGTAVPKNFQQLTGLDPAAIKDGQNSLVNLGNVLKQFQEGAKDAFFFDIASKKFEFVSDSDVARITNAAAATGNYATAVDDLGKANEAGAKAQFANIAAINGVNEATKKAILAKNTKFDPESKQNVTDYTQALADLREEIAQTDQVFQDVLDKTADFGVFSGKIGGFFKDLTDGVGNTTNDLISFALASDKAKLTAADLDAIAQKLGSSLTGEEFGAALTKITTAFNTTLEALKGVLPQFGDAVTTAFKDIKVDDTLTGLDAVQSAFDQFSLQHFIDELNKISEARATLAFNLNTLASISTEAVQDVLDLKLDPTKTAVLVSSLLSAGQEGIDAFIQGIHGKDAEVSTALDEVTRKLVEAGIDPNLLSQLGLDAGGAISTAITTGVKNIDTNAIAAELDQKIADVSAKLDAGSQNLSDETKLRQLVQNRANLPAGTTDTTQPTVDTTAAVQQAQSAGEAATTALSTSLQTGTATAFSSLSTTLAADIASLGPAAIPGASASGKFIAEGLILGVSFGLTPGLTTAVTNRLLETTGLLIPVATASGKLIALAFVAGFQPVTSLITTEILVPMLALFDELDKFLVALVTVAGDDASAAFKDALDLAGPAIDAIDEAIQAFELAARIFGELGRIAALEFNSNFREGLNLERAIAAAVGQAAGALGGLGELQGLAYHLGYSVGRSFGQGVAQGIRDSTPESDAAAADQVNSAYQEERRQGQAFSPSRLFAVLGRDLGMGLAVGINKSTPDVAAAAAAQVQAAHAATVNEAGIHSPSTLFAGLGGQLSAGLAQGISGATSQVASAVTAAIQTTLAAAQAAAPGTSKKDDGNTNKLADTVTSVFNVVIDRVNAAFELISNKLGVGAIFAGDPVRKFATGVLATRATAGVFGEAGPEALIPLGNGSAAANVIRQIAPYISSPGREAAFDLVGGAQFGQAMPSIVNHTSNNTFHIPAPTDDAEALAMRIASRLESRMTR